MAITTRGMDLAVVTYCATIEQIGGETSERRLPFAWVQFGDAGEERRYLCSRDGDSVGLTAPGCQPYRTKREYMRTASFPHDQDFGTSSSDTDARRPGPKAIHYFGGV